MDTYELVTKRIIDKMEKGIIPWKKPWVAKGQSISAETATQFAFNRVTKRAYSITNQFLLDHTGEYATFKQWTDIGGKIRKGSKAEFVVFWKWLEEKTTETDEDGNEVEKIKSIPYLRYYQVFHISCVDGVQPLSNFEETAETQFDEIQTAEELIGLYQEREQMPITFSGNEAYYSPRTDSITIPQKFKFQKNGAEFYSTVFHEIAHSTGHPLRLNRLAKTAFFGNEEYSKEELVAEISAASVLATLNIETENTFTNSAAYLQSWISVLQNDKRMFVIASAQADKAVEYIFNGKQQNTVGE